LISASQRIEFEERGVLRVERLVPASVTRPARDAVWSELERLKLRAGGKWHLRQLEGVPTFQITGRIAQRLQPLPACDALIPPALRALVDALAGTKLAAAQAHPSMLITPPQKHAWSVPHAGWHVDVRAVDARLPGIQVFVLVDDVAPRGGATIALAGSHRLLGSVGARQRALRESAHFRKLFEDHGGDRGELLQVRELEGIPLQVVEMHGRAGDVYLMDMRILHAPSTNSAARPRMSATGRYLRP
jgi:hypothetical protein